MKKKILCYFGIIFLFVMAFFPIILRFALPDKIEEKKTQASTKQLLLSCRSDKYMIVTNYIGDKIDRIMIKKFKVVEDEVPINESEIGTDLATSDNTNVETEIDTTNDIEQENNSNVVAKDNESSNTKVLDSYFNDLTGMNDVLYSQVEDGEILTIDYSVSTHPDMKIDKLLNPIDSQKLIYAEYGLTCEIREYK